MLEYHPFLFYKKWKNLYKMIQNQTSSPLTHIIVPFYLMFAQ